MENNVPLSLKSRILYQSESCVVVNKLKGEAVEGAAAGMTDLQRELATLLGVKGEFPQAVHRLDVPVTGCSLFALTKPALSFLGSAFAGESDGIVNKEYITTEDTEENNDVSELRDLRGKNLASFTSVEKYYWAVVEKPSRSLPASGELVHWIETVCGKNKSFAYNEEAPGRKKAALRYAITGEGKNYLFVTIELLSGRHHQIRAQLAAIGLRIKSDLKYGAKRSEKDGGIRLHARSLSFPDPLNRSEIISVTAEPPVMDALWEAFAVSVC